MQRPSLTLILSGLFIGYVLYAIYGIAQLFMPPVCEPGEPCLKSFLLKNSKLEVHLFTSPNTRSGEVHHLHTENFNYKNSLSMPLNVELPSKTRQNGTLFLHIVIIPESKKRHTQTFNQLQQNPHMVYTRVKLTQFAVPQAETFKLLGEKNKNQKISLKKNYGKPVSHLRSSITFILVTDVNELPSNNVPYEIRNIISMTEDAQFLPIIDYDFLQTRLKDLIQINTDDRVMNLTINYTPISIGHLRLIQHLRGTIEAFRGLGFSDKDVDDIKGIYADTNLYLLAATIFIASMHFLFDFLSFKNDVHFWRTKSSFEGLSVSSIIWRGFSQSIIFLYLLDERSSLLILIPAGVGTLIEMWKIKKVLRIKISRGEGIIPSIKYENKKNQNDETQTRKFDAQFMQYLSYLLYPLVIGGAVYSLIYQPHKSWYSWTINSMVNGVYAFGFLFMLPQLFVNYKLKSVAHLPWRAFMYKAFNTFIDDVFAFIITMPTAHRVACFRDDIVFLGYLYQRWLYPVDKSRIDTETIVEEPSTGTIISKKISDNELKKKIN